MWSVIPAELSLAPYAAGCPREREGGRGPKNPARRACITAACVPSVAVLVPLERPLDRNADVVGLLLRQCGQTHVQLLEVQLRHLQMTRPVEHARLGRLDVVRQPVNLSRRPQPDTLRYPTPDAGEHGEQILAQMGLGAAEIAALKEHDVI